MIVLDPEELGEYVTEHVDVTGPEGESVQEFGVNVPPLGLSVNVTVP